jgi:riboflavin kinase/FMN adenylyltransferase
VHVALSIGTRPTFTNNDKREVEAFLLDYDGDLYDSILAIDIISYLRQQEKFSDTYALMGAIANDVERVKLIVGQ